MVRTITKTGSKSSEESTVFQDKFAKHDSEIGEINTRIGQLEHGHQTLKSSDDLISKLVIGAIILVVIELLGISYDIAKNGWANGDIKNIEFSVQEQLANHKTKDVEIENVINNLKIENNKLNQEIESNKNIFTCLSYKKYWQYQDCLVGQK